ncbi:hypothetical protein BDV96DRAFT_653761 [Lophiotrema nucula]|uniref:WW domain-containing protein n=1 Tax=Lophiotrema nucula TaxID=690887 RepID=A0A6A5YK20_9PLEO|nr:hypothetical protein BDV96DRAFT_653761 [Lophiotrema nucula]
MSAERYAEIIDTVLKWLFQLPIQPHFLIEHTQKTYNGGWTRSFNPDAVGELLYTNMLAGPDARPHFRKPPILYPYANFDLPPGWCTMTTKGGRVYFQHTCTGLAKYQHPSNSSHVNQLSGWPLEPQDNADKCLASLGIQGKWALDDHDVPCLLSENVFRLRKMSAWKPMRRS